MRRGDGDERECQEEGDTSEGMEKKKREKEGERADEKIASEGLL